jgi:AP-3 complex subunit beta
LIDGLTLNDTYHTRAIQLHRNQREIQYVVLKAISNIVTSRPYMFRPFLFDFFIKVRVHRLVFCALTYVQGTDPLFVRTLKLDILTALTTKGGFAFVFA